MDPAERESAGIALARAMHLENGAVRLLVHSVRLPSADDYVNRTGVHAQLEPAFVAETVAHARQERLSVVFFHTHPFTDRAIFSSIDDDGETLLADFLARRLPNEPHAAIVLGRSEHSVRRLGGSDTWQLRVVGAQLNSWGATDAHATSERAGQVYGRQVLAFGPLVQERMRRLCVAVVGLGGTGSFVAQELAHLGVRDFVLMDPDVVEESNLNRVVGARHSDVSVPKVGITQRLIGEINPAARVRPLQESVLLASSARRLLEADVIFCCTDSHGSRFVLNQMAYQFFWSFPRSFGERRMTR